MIYYIFHTNRSLFLFAHHTNVSVSDVAYSLMYKIVIDDCVMISGSYILLSIVTYTQLIPPSSSPFTRNTPSPPLPPGTSDGASIMTGVDNYLLSRAVTVFTILSAETTSQWSQIHLVSDPHTAGNTLKLIPPTPPQSHQLLQIFTIS